MKAERLLSMITFLLNRELVTAKELMERYEVSERTIQRDMDSLSRAGIPVVSVRGVHGGYKILDTYKLKNHTQTSKDYESIGFALNTLRTAIDDQDLQNITEKYNSVVDVSSDDMSMDFGVAKENHDINILLSMIREAITRKKKITFQYCNTHQQMSKKLVEPISVHYKWYAWYLLGYCMDRRAYRVYKISRMSDYEVTHQSVFQNHHTPNLFEEIMAGDDRKTTELVFICKDEAMPVVKEYMGQVRINGQEVSVDIIESERFWFGILLSLGDQIKIIEPEHIKERFINHSKKIIENY